MQTVVSILLLFLLLMRKLTFVKFFVETTKSEKFFVCSLLNNIAVFHYKNHIRLTDGGESVCDNKTGPSLHQFAKGTLNAQFRSCINR